jgi:hypothetical protein
MLSLCEVYQVTQRLSGSLTPRDSSDNRFHVRPLNADGFLPEPWGYFSTKDEPEQDNETLPTKCLGFVNGKLLFENCLAGVSAMTKYVSSFLGLGFHSKENIGITTR